jgi:putative hemolysin
LPIGVVPIQVSQDDPGVFRNRSDHFQPIIGRLDEIGSFSHLMSRSLASVFYDNECGSTTQNKMEWIFILILILLNGFFSMSEIALVSSRKIRLEAATKAGKKGARAALDLASSPTRFLSTVQIGITLIGLLTGIYSGETLTNALEMWLMQFEILRPVADGLAVIIVLLIITYFTLVLGELVPKHIGLSNPEAISRTVAPVMRTISSLVLPFVWILTKTSDGIIKLLKIKPRNTRITEEEIKAIIHESTKGGEIQAIERDIVERVFALGDRRITSLMTTRSDLTFINIRDNFETIVKIINRDLHRVYPVFDGDKDQVQGVVFLKELFKAMAMGKLDINEQLKPAYFLTENTSAYAALEKFKQAKTHYALVTNEYGLVLGMVTLDDILLAMVGDVYEPGLREAQLQQRKDGTWLVDGEYPLAEFEIFFNLKRSAGLEYVNTLAGLILEKLNHIPKVGEKIHWNGFEFEVVDLDQVKIDKILVKRL